MYNCIVVGTDGSGSASYAVARASGLARAFDCPLHLVSVYRTAAATAGIVPEMGMVTPDLGDWIVRVRDDTEAMVGDLGRRLQREGVKAEFHTVAGHPVPGILEVAANVGADLIVVSNRGMQGVRRVLGSVPNSISHQAPCDVLVVHTC